MSGIQQAVVGIGLVCGLLSAPSPAQGGVIPNGDFEQGTASWTNIRFDDPAGSTGVAPANVSGTGISSALFADFRSTTRVSNCIWLGEYVVLPPGLYPVTLRVMWIKPQAAAIGDPSGNYIEFFVLDSASRHVFSSHLPVTQKATTVDRRTFTGSFSVPVVGRYRAYIVMRHSQAASMSYSAWVDDIVVGSQSWSVYGAGCPGSGGYAPYITAVGTPTLGSSNFAIGLGGAFAPTTAVLALGVSNTTWQQQQLPVDLGGGCAVVASLDTLLVTKAAGAGAGTGRASITLPIPNNATLRGLRVFAQWAASDPGAGSVLGMTTTGGLGFVID